MPMTSERHVLQVSDGDLEELRSRLRDARWPRPWPRQDTGDKWQVGTAEGELRRLVRYWADGYDWRSREAEVNALPGQVASLDGTGVFYLRFEAELPSALPIVLTHGWPGSFLELTGLAQRLAAPSRHGGVAGDRSLSSSRPCLASRSPRNAQTCHPPRPRTSCGTG